ncbi:O-Antigen ligase [Lacunisphaera limnophila]|uniref:O-Antigen ligase n=2 Tax=Lacunisphaera limnophila TaxID=1838286 RepID=A0A1D8AYA7_9BACT|nr:O-Antigen ligase [Lacunisphaera limnophila]
MTDHSQSLLRRFRSDPKQRLPLHPLERAVLTVVALHLCFLPWALGATNTWSQITSLCLSTLGILLALIPRTYAPGEWPGQPLISGGNHPEQAQRVERANNQQQTTNNRRNSGAIRVSALPRLLKFPLFWIGLALLAYIALQGYNPSWVWERNESTWWLRRVNDIPWLPTSIDTPFERFNLWRQAIIYASTWLTLCTVWVGFTRRRTIELLLLVLVVNATMLAITGFGFRMLHAPEFLLWFDERMPNVITFASFIYKNHAGAWLALMTVLFVVLATDRHLRSMQKMDRSSPAVIFVLGALLLFFAEIFTLSRGGTVLLAAYLIISLSIFFGYRLLSRSESTTHPAVPFMVTLMVVLVVGYGASQLDFRSVERRFSMLLQDKITDESVLSREKSHLANTDMLGDYWQRGVGAGGFRFLYPEYIKKHPEVYRGGRNFWEHAHNDWLQIPIELGAPGSALLLLGASWCLLGMLKRHVWRDLAALLLVLGLGQTLLHATFDFPLQNPAVLVTWCVLAVLVLRRLELEGA